MRLDELQDACQALLAQHFKLKLKLQSGSGSGSGSESAAGDAGDAAGVEGGEGGGGGQESGALLREDSRLRGGGGLRLRERAEGLARRIARKPALQLVRCAPAAIRRIHLQDLRAKYSYQVGYIVQLECLSIHARSTHTR
jgi:hypothetical protein